MSYNPRIKFDSDGILSVSGSLVLKDSESTITTKTVNTNFISSSNLSVTNLNTTEEQKNSLLVTGASLRTKVSKLTDSLILDTEYHILLVDASNNVVTVNLPSASSTPGQEFVIKKIDSTANPVNIRSNYTDKYSESKILSGSRAIETSDNFGYSVAINSAGNTAVIGANMDESGSTANTGLAYIFTSGSTGWTETAVLSGSYAIQAGDNFGYSVAINSAGNTVVVGASTDETGSIGGTGLAYIFTSGSTGWTESAVLSGSRAINSNDRLGNSVAIDSFGYTVILGAFQDEASTLTSSTGLAYIFTSGSTGWAESAVLSGSRAIQGSDNFGYSVAINSAGNTVVVGALMDEPVSGTDSGLAYIFTSGSTGWTESAVLSGSLAIQASDNFGYSVDINGAGNTIVVGTLFEDLGVADGGAAYVFNSGSTGWKQSAILKDSPYIGNTLTNFGCSVAINEAGTSIVVGSYRDEGPTLPLDAGIAYVYVSGTDGWILTNYLSGSVATQATDSFGYSVDIDSSGNNIIIGAIKDEKSGYTDTGLAFLFNKTGEIENFNIELNLTQKNQSVTLISDGTSSWSVIS